MRKHKTIINTGINLFLKVDFNNDKKILCISGVQQYTEIEAWVG